jgi:hypothetical protein
LSEKQQVRLDIVDSASPDPQEKPEEKKHKKKQQP